MAERNGIQQASIQGLFIDAIVSIIKNKCQTPALTEDKIKEKFVMAYNQVMKDKARIIEDVNEIIKLLSDTSELDAKIIEFQNKMEVISGLVDKLIKENIKTAHDQVEFAKKYEDMSAQYEENKNALDKVIEKKSYKQAQKIKMKAYLEEIKKQITTCLNGQMMCG